MPLVARELEARDPAVRVAAVFSMCALAPDDPRAESALTALFGSRDPDTLQMALGTLPPELTDRAWRFVIAMASHRDPAVVALVPRLLERAETDARRAEATAALLTLVGHESRSVQMRAHQALSRLR